MKDNRVLFVNIPGDHRLASVDFEIAIKCSPLLIENAEHQHNTYSQYQRYASNLSRQARSKVEDCLHCYTTEKILWRVNQAFVSLRCHDTAKVRFTLAVADSFMGKDCSTVELFTVLIKLNGTLFDLIKTINEHRDIKQSGIHFDYGITIQGFRQADGKYCSTPSVLVNTGINQNVLL